MAFAVLVSVRWTCLRVSNSSYSVNHDRFTEICWLAFESEYQTSLVLFWWACLDPSNFGLYVSRFIAPPLPGFFTMKAWVDLSSELVCLPGSLIFLPEFGGFGLAVIPLHSLFQCPTFPQLWHLELFFLCSKVWVFSFSRNLPSLETNARFLPVLDDEDSSRFWSNSSLRNLASSITIVCESAGTLSHDFLKAWNFGSGRPYFHPS